MKKTFTIRHISEHHLQILDEEARRNNMSRNDLMILLIANFAKNIERGKAEIILTEPLQDVTKQLNKLTQVTTQSNANMAADMTALIASVRKQNELLKMLGAEQHEKP